MSCLHATKSGEVGPNYHDWQEIYPELGILQERYRDILEEAQQVGTWVPWPEDHYAKDITESIGSRDGYGNDSNNDDEAEDGRSEASETSGTAGEGNEAWTVFPFLHTFPAYEESQMTWIKSTCDHCPITSGLIASIPNIRTALFSRMAPGCVLASHTGKWIDNLTT